MDQKPQDKKHRHWSWKKFAIALSLIPIGLFLFDLGFDQTHYDVSGIIEILLEIGGLCITVGGIIWVTVLLTRFFVLRRHSRRP